MAKFESFNKIPRLSREVIITEKLDGTNAQILITEEGEVFAGSRNRWITPESDNFGFASWVRYNKEELLLLGPGRHYGEWWGQGIQRGYGLTEKRFSLFNTARWTPDVTPNCCHVVPVIYTGIDWIYNIDRIIGDLEFYGSRAAPGYNNPEGIVIYHTASNTLFKKTIENDDEPKSRGK